MTTTVATGDVLSRYLRSRLTTHMEVCFGQNGWATARLLEPSGVASFDRAVLADGERWQPEDAHAACRRVSVSYQPE